MKTNQVASVVVMKDTDLQKLFSNIEKSELQTCIVTSEDNTKKNIELVLSEIRKQGKTSMADSVNADIRYCTYETDSFREPCVFRFAVRNSDELTEHLSFFRELLRRTQKVFMLLRCEMNVNEFLSICDENIDVCMLDKIALIGVPVCLSSRYRLTAKDVLDIKEVITDEGIVSDTMLFTGQYRKSSAYCRNCSALSVCFGILRQSTFSELKTSQKKSSYESIYDLTSEIADECKTESGILEFEPGKFQSYPIGLKVLQAMQDCRLKRNFDGQDFFYVWDFKESCYFNRPMEETDIFTQDPRGLMGMNWLFIGKGIPELEWKQKCDLLLPKHGFNTTVKVKFNKSWTPDRQKALDDLTFSTIIRVVKEHGGTAIEQIGNDLLYRGRKFAGKEWMFIQNVGYIENTVVTCEYLPEKQHFDRLFHHEKEKPITGITDQIPSVTKEVLMTEINKAVKELLKQ